MALDAQLLRTDPNRQPPGATSRLSNCRFVPRFIESDPASIDTLDNTGNMGQFFTHDNEAFFNELVEKYGPVSKLIGSLGVRLIVVLAG